MLPHTVSFYTNISGDLKITNRQIGLHIQKNKRVNSKRVELKKLTSATREEQILPLASH